jgi:adenylosuccinate synthase
MANRVVVGTQWGDEGKGKIVDLLASSADWVARYSGGANAGHTVKIGADRFALHLVPTGILAPRARCIVGSGMVVDLPRFFAEVDELIEGGITVENRLFIAASAHLVLPHHKALEAHAENGSNSDSRIGTTMRGIGPAYADKVARRGVRMADFIDPDRLKARVTSAMQYWDDISGGLLAKTDCRPETVIEELLSYRERLLPMLADPSKLLSDALSRGESILFEGAQGFLLDIDFGTYPYVTSSNTITGSVFTGLGVPPRALDEIVGVVKAYTTRVGHGPFPTEATEAQAESLRKNGDEFGTTTGRPRRCGWLDLVALKYAVRVDGITHIAVTKLDVLDTFDEIPVCVAYELDGERITDMPLDRARLCDVKPVYKTLPGWKQSTAGLTEFDELPAEAKDYLNFVCHELGVKLLLVSTGPKRKETIFCNRNRETVHA